MRKDKVSEKFKREREEEEKGKEMVPVTRGMKGHPVSASLTSIIERVSPVDCQAAAHPPSAPH